VLAFIAIILFGALASCASTAYAMPTDAAQYKRTLIREAHIAWGLNAPVATFAGQIHQESHWRTNAVSAVGAQGLAQFMPATASWISGAYKWGEPQANNPTWAIRALVNYDKWLSDRIKARDDCNRMAMTLSAYNGGLGWVIKDQQLASAKGADSQVWFNQVEKFNAGRTQASIAENRAYPRNILYRWQPLYTGWGMGVACA
jgi:soluble lytic murein transglycosylase-like protein